MRQNITLSMDSTTLQQARELAAQRHVSISKLLAEDLEAKVAHVNEYEQARRQALSLLEQLLFDLHGQYLSRDEAHAR